MSQALRPHKQRTQSPAPAAFHGPSPERFVKIYTFMNIAAMDSLWSMAVMLLPLSGRLKPFTIVNTILEHIYKISLQSFLLFLYSFCLFGGFCFWHII